VRRDPRGQIVGVDLIEIPMLKPDEFAAKRHRRELEDAGLASV
jgi:hypothetical protein